MEVKSGNQSRAIATSAFSIIAALLFLAPYWAIPQFSETFSAFGTELPLLSQLVISGRVLYLSLFVVSLLLNLVWFVRADKPIAEVLFFRASIVAIIVSAVCLGVTMFAMYLPIFSLG